MEPKGVNIPKNTELTEEEKRKLKEERVNYYVNSLTSKLPNTVIIEEEINLIKDKKSKLSRSQRDKVVAIYQLKNLEIK